MKEILHVGLDVGSTTIKIVILNDKLNVIYSNYTRHFSDTKNTICKIILEMCEKYKENLFTICLTGSGAMSASDFLEFPFIQEVISCKCAVEKYFPQTDVVIELGGEDAKIIYFDEFIEQRMNGTCAGGTGAFLDQMAVLLDTDTKGLDNYAKNYKIIYPIASRCGVFAKTDIQPLINEGAKKEDISASIFQAVVNQTISGLACGRPIKGNVAFLGGPLNHLPNLRKRFIETLNLKDEEIIIPEDAHILVAKGAALNSIEGKTFSSNVIINKVEKFQNSKDDGSNVLKPLFETNEDLEKFKTRHSKSKITRKNLENFDSDCFLGIDAGSTTTKIVLIDKNGNLLYSLYRNNEGNPLNSVKQMILEMYDVLPEKATLRLSGVTGYGENLIKTGLNIDLSEIETIAHYTAAAKFMPNVTAIVDIGGQDMKYIKMKNNYIDNIMLNEACSSGCGSFIHTFATSLKISIEDFVIQAINAKTPVDLGSRCTVFMNSKIKQAQKEGYSIGDISAGLSYSVVKNALQKVMKIRDTKTLGNNILVQGGTFYNDAVLRAFELTIGKNVVRPDIAGLMGAYGIALLAKEQYLANLDMDYKSTILSKEEILELKTENVNVRCNKCENHCLLTTTKFSNGKKFISGNRCERGAGGDSSNLNLPNLYKFKYKRVFEYTSLNDEEATRGKIGIPRALNMYENYPFWHTLFTKLKFKVILSEATKRKTYESGMNSMPSESVCYPAKLTHGHIENLIENGVKTIFYPCIPFENKEYKGADNYYNCPIVISYSEVIKNNVETLKQNNIKFINPFLPLDTKGLLERLLEIEEFKEYNFTKKELKSALKYAQEEYNNFKKEIKLKGEETLDFLNKTGNKAIVLSGRPYHLDPEINHGIDTMITSLGLAVLTEDSISHLTEVAHPLRVVDQWMYHSRLYAAADVVSNNNNLELVQLNSFGCGIDAVTTDQVEEILSSTNKIYTLLKIDEINNLGAIRIRIRSLIANMKKREKLNAILENSSYAINKVVFTKEMKKNHTLLFPQMSPIHFELLEAGMKASGYNVVCLKECTDATVETGLKYVNNDACYPSIIVIGQLIEALQSGKYDINNTSVLISQTGGGCRATNYIGFLRKALKDANFEQVPVVSFNLSGMEKMPGFKITLKMANRLIKGILYGDLLQKLLHKNKPYEINKGETEALYNIWMEKCKKLCAKSTIKNFKDSIYNMVEDFEKIKIDNAIIKPKVGIVGEILIKYHPFGNNNIVQMLEEAGAEVTIPDFMGFIKFITSNKIFMHKFIKNTGMKAYIYQIALDFMNICEYDVKIALSKSKKNYMPPCNIMELSKNVEQVLSVGNQTGEGWFLTAEMLEFIEHGVPNIVCVQPFACLPNHVVGKGVIKTIRSIYKEANIAPIDYDPGASKANQNNRIKLMLTVAKDNLKLENKRKKVIEQENKEQKILNKI